MTASTASIDRRVLAPAVRPGERTRATTPVRLVPAPRRAPRRRWVTFSLVALGGVLVAQLGLSIVISQGAYEVDTLTTRQTQLDRERSAAYEGLSSISSPQNLAQQATALGMVPSGGAQQLDLATGALIDVAGDAPPRAPINPALVTNEALNPTAPNAANHNYVAPAAPVAPGGASATGPYGGVPSITELGAPRTR